MIGLDPYVIMRSGRQGGFIALHVKIGMGSDPRVIRRGVVRYIVQHQLDVAAGQSLPEARQRRLAAKGLADAIGRDRKSGTADIVLGEVRQKRFELSAPFRIAARHGATGSAGLPHAQRPDPIEPVFDEAIQDGVIDIGERELSAGFTGQMLEPDARIELEERWVSHSGHARCLLYLSWPRPMPAFRRVSPSSLPKISIRVATMPVHPVWWLAPIPAPLSPWKNS